LWRKNKARKKDPEEKVQTQSRDRLLHDGQNSVQKEARVKQKIWARATARWKSHARYSAQQRRGKRTGHKIVQAQSSSISLGGPQTISEALSLYPPVPLHDASVLPWVPSPRTNHSISLPEISDMLKLSPYSPPAYHSQGAQIPSITLDSSHAASSNLSLSTSYRFRRPSPSMTTDPSRRSSFSADQIPYVPPYDGAHVAVDDKGLLARLADLASAPPIDGGGPTDLPAQVSAPEWHDEELDDFASRTSLKPPASTQSHPSTQPFPPPPLFKGKLSVGALYENSYSFEDLASEHESSPPSFEGSCPSAPPLEDIDMIPSAPPLADDPECGQSDQEDKQSDLSADNIGPVHGPVGSNRIPPCYSP
jgi:hypothetical protein